jgi:hypothetical protein
MASPRARRSSHAAVRGRLSGTAISELRRCWREPPQTDWCSTTSRPQGLRTCQARLTLGCRFSSRYTCQFKPLNTVSVGGPATSGAMPFVAQSITVTADSDIHTFRHQQRRSVRVRDRSSRRFFDQFTRSARVLNLADNTIAAISHRPDRGTARNPPPDPLLPHFPSKNQHRASAERNRADFRPQPGPTPPFPSVCARILDPPIAGPQNVPERRYPDPARTGPSRSRQPCGRRRYRGPNV